MPNGIEARLWERALSVTGLFDQLGVRLELNGDGDAVYETQAITTEMNDRF